MSMRFTLSMVEDRPPSLQSRLPNIVGQQMDLGRLLPGASDSWGRRSQQNPYQVV